MVWYSSSSISKLYRSFASDTGVSPGADDTMIPAGGEIESTQGCIDLFALLGQMIFSQTGRDDGK